MCGPPDELTKQTEEREPARSQQQRNRRNGSHVYSNKRSLQRDKGLTFSSSLPLSTHRKVSRVCFTSASKPSEVLERETKASLSLPLFHSSTPRKVSRVCFTSASKPSEAQNAAEVTRDKASIISKEVKDSLREAGEKASDISESAKESVKSTKDKAEENAEWAKEKTSSAAKSVTENTKEGMSRATETAQNFGEKAKQTVQDAWVAANETTEKIKETVVGTSEEIKDSVENELEKEAIGA